MTQKQLAKLIADRLTAKGWTDYQLAKQLHGRVAPQTAYNVAAGKVTKSDTLLAVLDVLDLEIVVKEGK